MGVFCRWRHKKRHCLDILATIGLPWALIHRAILLTQSFCENYIKFRVYRALDWLFSISVMGQKPSFWPNSKLFRKDINCPFRPNLASHNSAADWAREPHKPCNDWLRRVVRIKKNIFNLDGGFGPMGSSWRSVFWLITKRNHLIPHPNIVARSICGF